jgi:hypothetical protein
MSEALRFCVFVSFFQYYNNTGQTQVKQLLSGRSFTHISDLLVEAAVAVTASDAIVVIVFVVLGDVREAVCVAACVSEPDSSQATAATVANTRKFRSSLPLPVRLQKLEIALHKHQLTHSLVCLPLPHF